MESDVTTVKKQNRYNRKNWDIKTINMPVFFLQSDLQHVR